MDATELVPSPPSARSRWLARLVRLWSATWRVRRHDATVLRQSLQDGPVVLAFWHEDLAVLGPLHADRDFVGMVSQSRDGERLSGVLEQLGYRTVRGSTSKGARAVALATLRALKMGRTVALAVDGPRGPRRQVQPGAERLGKLAKRPVVLVACAAWPAVRLSSWDRQRLPLPFARVEVVYSRWLEDSDLGASLGALAGDDGVSVPTSRAP